MASRDQRALLVAYLEEGDVAARDRLVEELMPLVRSLANRYAGRGEPTEDLVQVGAIGLVKAIDRFELEKGVELSTYAVPTIVGEIRRHFRDRTWGVHVPRRLKELSMRLSRTRDELSAQLVEAMYASLEDRVVRRLAALAVTYRSSSSEVTIPLTQDDLSQLVGGARPSVNQVLRRLGDEGLLEVRRGRIIVHDVSRLDGVAT